MKRQRKRTSRMENTWLVTAAGFHLTWASHQLTCWQSVIVPASRCVSCSSSALACCRLWPTLLPACYCTPRSPRWRLVLFRAAWHGAVRYTRVHCNHFAKMIKDQCNIYHVYSTVLAVMDLVVSDNGTAVCPDLYSCQGIAVDVISFDEASTVTENINATLIAIENGIAPIWRQRKRRN